MKTALLILAGFVSSALVANATARPNKPGPLPAEEMAAIMIADYDADENDALDATELVTAFSEFRNKRRAENAADCPRQGQGRRGGGGPDGRRGGPPPPEELSVRLMEDFDADGDASLNTSELLKALDFMRSRGPRGRPPVFEEDATTVE